MNIQANTSQLKAAATYNAASDHFDAPPLGFWVRHSRRAVELASLQRGDRVLDVGCGTGASALPAARAVGPQGAVVGIDIAEAMVTRAKAKAREQGLANASFRVADMTQLDPQNGLYDAVIAVFAVFFTADMEAQIARFWNVLRPGGRLIVTVWGERALQPGADLFSEELRRVRPDTPPLARPWERLTDPENLRTLIETGTGKRAAVITVSDYQPLSNPSDWWTIVLGSGYRGEIERLDPKDQQKVKAGILGRLRDEDVGHVETHAIHTIVRKPV